MPTPARERLPDTRQALTHVFRVPNQDDDTGSVTITDIYATVGLYPDGRPAELFLECDKAGSLANGVLDATAILISIALQHGVPLRTITSKLRHTTYNPRGFTSDPEFPSCSSILDLIANWLEKRFPDLTS